VATEADAIPQAERFEVDIDPALVIAAYPRHRRRFAEWAASLDGPALATRTRCTEWTVADLLRHLSDVDGWLHTIWAGELPFASFDPRVTPHNSVVESRSVSEAEVRDRYIVSATDMAAEVEGSQPDRWALPSVSVMGAVPWWLGLVHTFWDSWVHERDALIPLGCDVVVVPEEIAAVLPHSLALAALVSPSPIDAVVCGYEVTSCERTSTITQVGDGAPPSGLPILDGDPPTVVDAISGRGSLEDALTGDPEVVHRLGSFARFLTAPAHERAT